MLRCLLFMFIAALVGGTGASADEASGLFRDRSQSIVQVRVLESASGTKEGYGSGFYISPDGLLLTNYHVVSRYVFRPKKYSLQVKNAATGERAEAELVAFDAVHDLALLKAEVTGASVLPLAKSAPDRGERLFSLGNPRELGFSIVEGTYNGIVENSYIKRLHFTGSINGGMSGGPVLDQKGKVVGINVATYGEQMALLVPVQRARELLESAEGATSWPPRRYFSALSEQLLHHQAQMIDAVDVADPKTVQLGRYRVPTDLIRRHSCWSQASDTEDERYDVLTHMCQDKSGIHLGNGAKASGPYLFFQYYTPKGINSVQFYELLSTRLKDFATSSKGSREHFTNFSCRDDFVDTNAGEMRLSLCLRSYRTLDGLYDLILVGATSDRPEEALLMYVSMNAISLENVGRLTRAVFRRLS